MNRLHLVPLHALVALLLLTQVRAAETVVPTGIWVKRSFTQTDWPLFGGNLEQTGLLPARGPAFGERPVIR